MIPGGVNELLLRSAGAGGGDTPYTTAQRSVRFNSADSAYLSRTPASAGNRKTWTWSGWIKRSKISNDYDRLFGSETSASTVSTIRITMLNPYEDCLEFHHNDGTNVSNVTTAAKLRDPSAWYHIVVSVDTTQATSSNRTKIYINGVQQTLAVSTYLNQNVDTFISSTNAQNIGRSQNYGSYFNGYLALVHFIDGQALTPSSFAFTNTTTGRWEPKVYSGTGYGTNGFFLDFADNSAATATTLGKDNSGVNSNNWTPNNISVTAGIGNDCLRENPVSVGTSTGLGGEVSGNYCTLNGLANNGGTLSNGNYDHSGTTALTTGTIFAPSGKWYCEFTCNTDGGGGGLGYTAVGVIRSDQSINTAPTSIGSVPSGLWAYRNDAVKINNGASASYGNTWTAGDVIGVAFDVDAGKLWFAKNGTWQASGDPAAGTNAAYTNLSGSIGVAINDQGTYTTTYSLNTGARAFAYTAPAGFSPLVDTLLPTPTIAKPNTVMDAVAYTGTGSSNTITLPGSFNPDLIWIKRRSAASDHCLMDVVRGFGSSATKILYSNLTNSEDTTSIITSTSSTGFTIGGSGIETNANGSTYVAWTWDAGSSNATNTSGTITSTVRANISAGFSVVSYTGTGANATVGHGLGVAPSFTVVKNRDFTDVWLVYHSSLGATKYIILNRTDAAGTISTAWNNTAPTSSVFSIGSLDDVNRSSNKFIAYCWTPVAGYSAFGSYTGNGSSDGPFVYTGFRPRWILTKTTNRSGAGAESWFIHDAARDGYNFANQTLYPNLGSAEGGAAVDILSNGFKLRSSANSVNGGGDTYIYACFAESPLPYARAR